MPIQRALDTGADIVITGRCTDSALALGPLMHSHGWKATELDLLAQGMSYCGLTVMDKACPTSTCKPVNLDTIIVAQPSTY